MVRLVVPGLLLCLGLVGCAHHDAHNSHGKKSHHVKSASYIKTISPDDADDPNFRPDPERAGTIIRYENN